jgi:hypothetical protein
MLMECVVMCLMRGTFVHESRPWTWSRALVRTMFGDAHNVFGEMPERTRSAPIELKSDVDDPRGLVMTRV